MTSLSEREIHTRKLISDLEAEADNLADKLDAAMTKNAQLRSEIQELRNQNSTLETRVMSLETFVLGLCHPPS